MFASHRAPSHVRRVDFSDVSITCLDKLLLSCLRHYRDFVTVLRKNFDTVDFSDASRGMCKIDKVSINCIKFTP